MRPNDSAENIFRNFATTIGQPFGPYGGIPVPLSGVDYTIHYLNPLIRF